MIPMTNLDPQYTHDCPDAHYLGRFQEFDLYYCDHWESKIRRTVVARYGNKPEEYISGIFNAQYEESLREALDRAIKLGFIVD